MSMQKIGFDGTYLMELRIRATRDRAGARAPRPSTVRKAAGLLNMQTYIEDIARP